MVSFRKKIIKTKPKLGEQLAAARKQRQLTLKDVALKCSIQLNYLQALEAGEYHKLPGEVYARSFLKVYGDFLKLEPDALLKLYISESTIYQNTRQTAHQNYQSPVAKISRSRLIVVPRMIRGISIGLLALLVVVYLGAKVQAIVAAPQLSLHSPVSDLVTELTVIEVTGYAETGSIITVNGEHVVADQSGNFTELVDLKVGINTIEIQAKKKHSQSAVISRQIVVIES